MGDREKVIFQCVADIWYAFQEGDAQYMGSGKTRAEALENMSYRGVIERETWREAA